MRRVLLVSITFPPHVDVGTERAVRFVSALSGRGFAVDVLTSGAPGIGRSEPESMKLVPEGTRVFCTGLIRPYLPVSAILKMAPMRWHNIIASNLMVPDAFIGWYPLLVKRAKGLLNAGEGPYSAIISTSPPHSAQIGSQRLKRMFNAPWIADLRDPWAGNPLASRSTRLHKRLHLRLESMVMEGADAVIASTDRNARELRRRYPASREKIHVVNNSYDEHMPCAMAADRPASRGKTLKLFYGGTLHPQYDAGPFFKGLSMAVKKHPAIRDLLRLDIYGARSERKRIDGHGLSGIVREHGALSREVFLRRLAESDAALLILNPLDRGQAADFWVPAKLYQYLGVSKPVMALVPRGEAREMIEASGLGYVCRPSDTEAIARTIIEVFIDWQMGALKRFASTSIRRYSTGVQMQRFMDVVDSLVGAREVSAPSGVGRSAGAL